MIAIMWDEPRCPRTNGIYAIHGIFFMYMEYCSVIKKNEIVSFARQWRS
jgi:hypothetical protein